MQSRASVCSPQTLIRLQNIFDTAWLQLSRKRGRHSFPWAAEASRYTLAQIVLTHARDVRQLDEIVQEVLTTMDDTPTSPPEHPSRKEPA
jgi:hypothetical protein